jgi:hypothetical protein
LGLQRPRAELPSARGLAEQLFQLAHRLHDATLLPMAHAALGAPLFDLGELVACRGQLEQGIALYDLQHHRRVTFQYGDDPGVVCLSFLTETLWMLGYPDQALARSREVLALSQDLGHPFNRGWLYTSRPCCTTSAGRGKPPKHGPRRPLRC